jgi:hypothetical protein
VIGEAPAVAVVSPYPGLVGTETVMQAVQYSEPSNSESPWSCSHCGSEFTWYDTACSTGGGDVTKCERESAMEWPTGDYPLRHLPSLAFSSIMQLANGGRHGANPGDGWETGLPPHGKQGT